jgi:sialic acid synthase SpsE/glycosyltransferase involved in cell wall biosynthesis
MNNSTSTVKIGGIEVGRGLPCVVVAEIGINHNGDVGIAKQLVDVAAAAGCAAVKFQKRTVEVVYTPEELSRIRESPFGTTNGELKRALEFDAAAYREIASHCAQKGILWFASCWDEASVDFMAAFDPPCYKIASASLTDDALLAYTRAQGKPIILATGMSTLEQVDHAVEILGTDQLIILHACSTYPAHYDELNLRVIQQFAARYPVPIGYSGHETGIPSSVAAVAMGACMVERHVTLDRSMAATRRRLSSRTAFIASCATSGSSRRRWATASSACSIASCRSWKSCAASDGEMARLIDLVAMDFDGVLTDGSFWWGPDGAEWKRLSFTDVMGISLGTRAGLRFALISGEDSPLLDRYAAKMKITDLYKGCKDKRTALVDFAGRHGSGAFMTTPTASALSDPAICDPGRTDDEVPPPVRRRLIGISAPCFNEEDNVVELVERIRTVFGALPQYDYQIVLIDNASTDRTVERVKAIAATDPRVKLIVNERNFGHIRSPLHGFLQARGDAVIGMASDLQDPPELIPEFVRYWEQGFKVVTAVKPQSKETFAMFLARRLYYKGVGRIADVPLIENYTGFGLYDREVVEQVRATGDRYPYFRGLIAELGYARAEVPFVQPRRKRGISKNNFYTLYDIAMLGMTSHSKVPLRLATMSGFALALVSLMVAIGYLIAKLLFWNEFSLGVAPLVIGVFFFASVQLFFVGILGEYIGAIHTQVHKRPLVIERERVNFDDEPVGDERRGQPWW